MKAARSTAALSAMSHCLLILSDSGLPLYTRTSDKQSASLPFSTTGLLSALHSSSAAQHFPVRALHTADACVQLVQQDSAVLLLASHSPQAQSHPLERMRDCLVLLLGRRALQDERQLQRAKRRMRQCAPLLDWWMRPQRSWDTLTGLPLHSMHGAAAAEWAGALLSEVSAQCGTRHVCLYDGERLLLPSSQYAQLHPHDLLSIAAYIATLAQHASTAHTPAAAAPPSSPAQPAAASHSGVHDQPIYLSHSTLHRRQVDGSTAYRLLVCPLQPSAGLHAVLLCGPSPAAEQVEQAVGRAALQHEASLAQWRRDEAALSAEAAASGVLAGVVLWKSERCWPVQQTERSAQSAAHERELHAFYCMFTEDVETVDGQQCYAVLEDGVVHSAMRRGDWRLFVAVRAAGRRAARELTEQILQREQKRHSELQQTLEQLKI